VAVVTFEDGTKATIHSNDTTLGGVRNVVSAYLTSGVVHANITPNTAVVAYAPEARVWGEEYITEKVETTSGWQFPSPEEDWMRGYPQELEDFVDAIHDGRPPLSDASLAREVVEVIYAGYLSRRAGGAWSSSGHDPVRQGAWPRQRLRVLEQKSLPGPLTTAAIRRICDRNYGVGSDGILLLTSTARADFGLRIFNPDGSEAEKSGNGLRIFAKYLWDHGYAKQPTFTVDTRAAWSSASSRCGLAA